MDTPLKYLLAIFGFNSQGLACAMAELAFADAPHEQALPLPLPMTASAQ